MDFNETDTVPTWYAEDRAFLKGGEGDFDEVSVKDPSIVYADGKYHLFFTGAGKNGQWQMGYASAESIEGLKDAEHIFLGSIAEGYFCAPQVFYFEPHQKWYMLYNSGTFGAAYATTTNINDPAFWNGPKSLELPEPKGYDYWVICDDEYAYIFYTESGEARRIISRRTPLDKFPIGWSDYTVAATDTFEAVAVYKSLSDRVYYMLPEDYYDNRYFELWSSKALNGPWTKINEKWASRRNLEYNGEHWTDNVSHGEIIRAGINQKLEIEDINKVDFLIQGVKDCDESDYFHIPYDLGIIRNYKK